MGADRVEQLLEIADGERVVGFLTALLADLDEVMPDLVLLGAGHAVVRLLELLRFCQDGAVQRVAAAELGDLHLGVVVLTEKFERGIDAEHIALRDHAVAVVTGETVDTFLVLGIARGLEPTELRDRRGLRP